MSAEPAFPKCRFPWQVDEGAKVHVHQLSYRAEKWIVAHLYVVTTSNSIKVALVVNSVRPIIASLHREKIDLWAARTLAEDYLEHKTIEPLIISKRGTSKSALCGILDEELEEKVPRGKLWFCVFDSIAAIAYGE